MKSIILFALLLFFFQSSFAQIEPRLYQKNISIDDTTPNEFRIHHIVEYNFNNNEDIIELIQTYYNLDGEIQNRIGTFYAYNDNGLLSGETLRRFNFDVNLWISIEWTDHIYNNNGCEIVRNKTENIGGLFSTIEYERNDNCQITKESVYTKLVTANDIRFISVRDVTYLQDGISYEEINWNVNSITEELRFKSKYIYQYDANEFLENEYAEIHQNLGGYWYEYNVDHFYDSQHNEIKRSTSIKTDPNEDWVLSHEFLFVHEYDDQDRLIKTNRERYYYPEPGGNPVLDDNYGNERIFDYYCSDLVEREDVRYSSGAITYREDFFYEGKDDCFEIADELLEFSIYPNPSFGNATLTSPIFQSGDTQIMVFDLNGKLLLEKIEIKRDENTSLSLEALPNGMYVIQLMNQEHFIQDKIVISK